MIEQQLMNNKPIFEQLWDITKQLKQKLEARFELNPNPSTQDLQSYSSMTEEAQGSLNTFSGSEIDWLVHSWIRDSKSGFSNMHLSIWLKPHIRVPHLSYAFGTFPQLFFYMDYIPRTDLYTDLEYLDCYYEPMNQTYLTLQADSRLKPFVSKTLYMRQAQSQTSLCYTCSATDDTITLLSSIAHEMMERWLNWVDEAEAVAESERTALFERDFIIRRAIAERDPQNQFGVQLFGAELTDRLVRSLWGGDRIRQ
jgi:Red chlorophyll catabolite reductase (RCC reductase)